MTRVLPVGSLLCSVDRKVRTCLLTLCLKNKVTEIVASVAAFSNRLVQGGAKFSTSLNLTGVQEKINEVLW